MVGSTLFPPCVLRADSGLRGGSAASRDAVEDSLRRPKRERGAGGMGRQADREHLQLLQRIGSTLPVQLLQRIGSTLPVQLLQRIGSTLPVQLLQRIGSTLPVQLLQRIGSTLPVQLLQRIGSTLPVQLLQRIGSTLPDVAVIGCDGGGRHSSPRDPPPSPFTHKHSPQAMKRSPISERYGARSSRSWSQSQLREGAAGAGAGACPATTACGWAPDPAGGGPCG
eukprot:gene19233-22014_t